MSQNLRVNFILGGMINSEMNQAEEHKMSKIFMIKNVKILILFSPI